MVLIYKYVEGIYLTYLLKKKLGIDLSADIYSEYIFGYNRDNEVISGVRL